MHTATWAQGDLVLCTHQSTHTGRRRHPPRVRIGKRHNRTAAAGVQASITHMPHRSVRYMGAVCFTRAGLTLWCAKKCYTAGSGEYSSLRLSRFECK